MKKSVNEFLKALVDAVTEPEADFEALAADALVGVSKQQLSLDEYTQFAELLKEAAASGRVIGCRIDKHPKMTNKDCLYVSTNVHLDRNKNPREIYVTLDWAAGVYAASKSPEIATILQDEWNRLSEKI